MVRLELIGQPVPVRAVVPFTSATLPAVADMAMLPLASGAGRLTVPPVPADSWTRKKCPGCTDLFPSWVTCHEVPVLDAYCTLSPFVEMDALVGLKSSTKSLVSCAPELPPPP